MMQPLQKLTATPPAASSVMTAAMTRLNQAWCLLFLSSGWNLLASSSSNANTRPYTVLWRYYNTKKYNEKVTDWNKTIHEWRQVQYVGSLFYDYVQLTYLSMLQRNRHSLTVSSSRANSGLSGRLEKTYSNNTCQNRAIDAKSRRVVVLPLSSSHYFKNSINPFFFNKKLVWHTPMQHQYRTYEKITWRTGDV